MRSGKPPTVHGANSTRRQFLRSAVTAGAALAGSLAGAEVAKSTELKSVAAASRHGFSALPADFIYLNSGTEGSMPECVISTFQDGLQKWASDPTTSYESDALFGKRQELSREKVGRFLGAGKDNICLTDNTTMGLSMALMGLNFQPEDRVVITNHEHTAIRSPLSVLQARLGLKMETRAFPHSGRLGALSSEELLEALFPDTPAIRGAKALCVSHVYPTTGLRLPLGALRQKVIQLEIKYLIVDGAQALGMIDLRSEGDSISNCDFYACPGHKWLNGPPGTGVLYIQNSNIRPPEFYPTISQRMESYSDSSDSSDNRFPMAKALQVRGCSNVPGFSAMVSAMEFVDNEGGSSLVGKHILDLAREVKRFILAKAPSAIVSPYVDEALESGLTTFFPFQWESPQTVFTDKKRADWVVRELLKRKIQVRSIGFQNAATENSAAGPAYAIRVSTGYFNSIAQINSFKRALQEVLTMV